MWQSGFDYWYDRVNALLTLENNMGTILVPEVGDFTKELSIVS